MKQFQFLLQEGFVELLVSGWYMEIEVGVGQCLVNFVNLGYPAFTSSQDAYKTVGILGVVSRFFVHARERRFSVGGLQIKENRTACGRKPHQFILCWC